MDLAYRTVPGTGYHGGYCKLQQVILALCRNQHSRRILVDMEAATITVSPHILVIDDDREIRELLARYLERQQFRVTAVRDAREARRVWPTMSFQLVVLDLMLPGEGGLDFARWLRSESDIPLVMLTALGDENDRIIGLELGADDYLGKPFEPRELLARVKALLRRASPQPLGDEVLRFGRLEIDLGARVARLGGQACDLTSHQFDLLVVLAQSPGRVLSRDQIMDSLKGHPLEAFDRSIDVHISRIRSVIEDDAKVPRRVLTVRGAGYVFAKKQDADDAS